MVISMYDGGKDKTRLLVIRLLLVLILCVCIFAFTAFFMRRRSSETIGNVGNIYMHSISDELALHFRTMVELRLDQLETLMTDVTSQREDFEGARELLAAGARERGFEYLGLCRQDGSLETIYGEELRMEEPDSFLPYLLEGQRKIDTGYNASGDKKVLLGVPCRGIGEEDCTALVAGLELDYISDTLSLNAEDAPVYSYIIRLDGSFVIRGGEAFREDYFERLRGELSGDVEKYVNDLKTAMTDTQHYSAVVTTHDERRHIHCTKLDDSEWYLLVVMPYGSLDMQISQLSTQWLYTAFGGCLLVMIAMLGIYSSYFREIRRQMAELDRVRQEAVNANRAKSEFLSNMSHDIRTPMNAIVGMTAIATANMDDREQIENCLKKITMSSRHLLGLINDVLDMSKIESGRLTLSVEQVSLREVIDSAVNIVQQQLKTKRQKFDVFVRDIFCENVCCDSVRLSQILLNLLGNSVKFTPEGGSIQITLYEEEAPKGENYVRVHLLVEDTGIGMEPEFLGKIFDAFTRADSRRVQKTEGSGLGMAITKYILDAMGGTIEVKSTLGEGSCFHVTLDLEKARISEEEMTLPDIRMLVVDDDAQLCESTIGALESMGIHAQWCLDGESAIKRIREKEMNREPYEIILLDWKLPGMDGLSLTREVREIIGKEIPILLISAYDWNEIENDARSAGVSGFISKPLFKSTLFYGLKPYLAGQTMESPSESEGQEDFTGRKILVAEDNDLNWEIANELLSSLGMELEWAENGEICVDKFSRSEDGYYDAILMDLRMPVMTGYEAAVAIRKLDRPDAGTIPIIAMTADAFAEDVKRCLDCGMNAHISKPIDVRIVAGKLKKFMK